MSKLKWDVRMGWEIGLRLASQRCYAMQAAAKNRAWMPDCLDCLNVYG
ncbi:hypothetical protein [Kingella sp. (in: b-proteobacteria)]|nr:hypothetical protein [Kingella sp. (in: b-proteobacteria)]MDO4657948.1 hypothetical protein [Kingella sp. (in: b-proteobacteria)]